MRNRVVGEEWIPYISCKRILSVVVEESRAT